MSPPTTPKAPPATPRKTTSPATKTRQATKTASAPRPEEPGMAAPESVPAMSTASRPRKAVASPAAKTRTARKAATPSLPDASAAAAPVPAPERSAGPALPEGPTREALIRQRAYERYVRNGCVAGLEVEDWLAAEAEVGALLDEGSPSAAPPGE